MRTLFDTNRQDSRFGPRSDPSDARARARDGPSQYAVAFWTHAVRPGGVRIALRRFESIPPVRHGRNSEQFETILSANASGFDSNFGGCNMNTAAALQIKSLLTEIGFCRG